MHSSQQVPTDDSKTLLPERLHTLPCFLRLHALFCKRLQEHGSQCLSLLNELALSAVCVYQMHPQSCTMSWCDCGSRTLGSSDSSRTTSASL